MNEPNKKPRELPLYFTPIHNLIIQTWLLSRIERSLVVLFASYQSSGCNWSREKLKEYCECGPYHLERAIKRLQFMHIIAVDRGGWKQSDPPMRKPNRYVYKSDPFNWRVTKDIQERILAETYSLKREPRPFEHEGFSNEIGLEIAFGKTFPKYALGRKGRKKRDEKNASPPTTPENESSAILEDQKWLKKIDQILADDVRFAFLAAEYYHRIEAIELARKEPAHGFSQHQLTYLERLHYIYNERKRSLKSDDEIALRNGIEIWLRAGRSYFDISNELAKLDQFQKKEIINQIKEEA